MANAYISSGAAISPDGRYRYRLWREWRNGDTPENNWAWLTDKGGKRTVGSAGSPIGVPKSVVFIMLNPSTADGETDDPTIRRCVGFAKRWHFDRIDVLNLFAYRTKSPAELHALQDDDDPVGPLNSVHFRSLLDNDNVLGCPLGPIVCAWGAHGTYLGQGERVLGWLEGRERFALGVSGVGQPSHPLYLPANSELRPYRPAFRGSAL